MKKGVKIFNISGDLILYVVNLEGAALMRVSLEEANLRGVNLRGANLREANLRGADLIGANLREANLRGADLIGANLRGADLIGANLREANLRGANLRGANLEGVSLKEANLEGANLPLYCKWNTSVIDNKIQIGCKIKSIEDWDEFFNSDECYETDRNSEEFFRIEAVYNAYKIYLQTLIKNKVK